MVFFAFAFYSLHILLLSVEIYFDLFVNNTKKIAIDTQENLRYLAINFFRSWKTDRKITEQQVEHAQIYCSKIFFKWSVLNLYTNAFSMH